MFSILIPMYLILLISGSIYLDHVIWDTKKLFLYPLDASLSSHMFLLSSVFVLLCTMTIVIFMIMNFNIILFLLLLSITSINLIITKVFAKKIVTTLIGIFSNTNEPIGMIYLITLTIMLYIGYFLPIYFLLKACLAQFTKNNYFYKLYVEQNKGDKEQ